VDCLPLAYTTPKQDSELHQLHAIIALQNSSIEQISFIEQTLMEDSIIEEEFPAWDDISSAEESEQKSTSTFLDTQDSNTRDGDLGNPNPGQDT
jgi:hypothetical protein